MVWGKAGSTTLTTAGTTVTTPTMTPSEFNVTLGHTYGTGSVNTRLRVGVDSIDTGNSYSNRYADNGGSDDTSETTANVIRVSSRDYDELNVVYGCNIAGQEKLFYGFTVNQENTGATSPTRTAFSAKWVTTAGQYKLIQWLNASADFPVGSNMTALGNEITPTAGKPTDIQVGSRFEETDTRKIYHFADNSTTGLIAYYNFDETSGTVLTNQAGTVGSSDSLGTSVNGTNVGTATVNQTGKIDKTYDFDGAGSGASNDHIAIPNALGIDLADTNKVSYSLWFNTDEWSTSQGNGWDLIGCYGSTTGSNLADYQGLGINYWYDGNFYVYSEYHGSFSGNAYGGISNTNLGATATGTWYHLVVVYDGTATGNANRLKIYLNGVKKTFDSFTGTIGSTINFGVNPTWIGRPSYSSSYQKNFNGKIDEVTIWKRVLTDDEISTLYTTNNAGNPIAEGVLTEWEEEGT